MLAAVVDAYGGPEVVRVVDVPRPAPRSAEVLVRVVAVAVTAGDARIRGARFPPGFGVLARLALGIRGPRRTILGACVSGVVEQVGSKVDGLAPGDEVCGMTGMKMGAHAQYVSMAASKLVRKPPEVPHEDAAGVMFGGSAALQYLRDKGSVGPGQSVLVNGASGAVGTNAVQLAVHLGATVTGVTSTANLALVRELGAAHVIDHTSVDLSSVTERFDVVLDAVGNLSIASGRRLLNPGGRLLLAAATLGDTIRARGDVAAGPASERVADVETLLRLVASGELRVVRDQTFALEDIAEAHRLVDTGHKVGNVVVCP